MATYTKYENGIQALLAGQIIAHGTTDTWKVAIVTDAPDAALDDELADTTQIAGNNGYTTGGEDVQNNGTRSGGTETVACVDVVWTALGGNLGSSTTGRYFPVHDDTSVTDKLIGHSAGGGYSTKYQLWRLRKLRELRQRKLERDERRIERVIERLEQARDGDHRAIEAAWDAADDIEFKSAADRLIGAIAAIDEANNKRAQIVAALVIARRVQEQIQQEDEEEEIILDLMLG